MIPGAFDDSIIPSFPNVDSIGNDLYLLDDISGVPFFDYPSKSNYFVSVICLRGEMEGSINLMNYTFSANQHITILPDQVLQYHRISDDFSGLFLVTSRRFSESLELIGKDSIQIFLHLKDHPITPLQPADCELMVDYYTMLKKTLRGGNSSHKREVVRLLLQAYFYSVSDIFNRHIEISDNKKSRQEVLFDQFYKMVLQCYTQSREVGFYADRLCLTPKYLSTVIKNLTGRSAYDWINAHVILEAKALLQSSRMSIQEISNALAFPNQSFFGKYFKQHTGMSPGEYRNHRKLGTVGRM